LLRLKTTLAAALLSTLLPRAITNLDRLTTEALNGLYSRMSNMSSKREAKRKKKMAKRKRRANLFGTIPSLQLETGSPLLPTSQ
jgi:hypothetical protein